MTQNDIFTRLAKPHDIPAIVTILKEIAQQFHPDVFDENHAWEHVTGIICDGVSFVAIDGRDIVGVLMCAKVDIAYAMTEHLETMHFYVSPPARKTPAAKKLLQALERYADERAVTVIFHQMDYQSALYGSRNKSHVIERLYRQRGYVGPVDIATVGDDARRVGVTYKYDGATHKAS